MTSNTLLRARRLLIGGLVLLSAAITLDVIVRPGSPGTRDTSATAPIAPLLGGTKAGASSSTRSPAPGQSPSGKASPSSSAQSSAGSHGAGPKVPAAPGGKGSKLQAVDGGVNYYGKFADHLPTSASFFPIGVWFAAVNGPGDTQKDKAAGINTYVQLTDNSNLAQVRDAGMYAIVSKQSGNGSETAAWLLADEEDMKLGPGSGYSAMASFRAKYPNDNRMRYANYGKGIAFWETSSQAAPFINNYQDVVSADTYWFTDNNICGSSEGGRFFGKSQKTNGRLPDSLCHRAANYGLTIDRERALVSPARSEPVWAFIELGHPSSQNDYPTITAPQIVAATWSSLIHGARGVIYFNHSFGGSCQTQNALRDSCYAGVRSTVTTLDAHIKQLAPELNAPFANGVLTTSSGVDASTKWYNGQFYVFSGSTATGSQTGTFKAPCVGNATATVLYENRSIPIHNGTFTDTFASPNSVHLYRIDGGSSCGNS